MIAQHVRGHGPAASLADHSPVFFSPRDYRLPTIVRRALAVWVLIFGLEVLHGVLRTIWLVPLVGDLPSRQIGVLTGSLLILVVALLTIRWIGARRGRDLLVVGLSWLVLMVGTEVALGRAVFDYPWARIAEDFDVSRGGFLGFGMAVLAAAPSLAHWLRPPPSSDRARSGKGDSTPSS